MPASWSGLLNTSPRLACAWALLLLLPLASFSAPGTLERGGARARARGSCFAYAYISGAPHRRRTLLWPCCRPACMPSHPHSRGAWRVVCPSMPLFEGIFQRVAASQGQLVDYLVGKVRCCQPLQL